LAPAAIKTIFAEDTSSQILIAEPKINANLTLIENRLRVLKTLYPQNDFIWSGFPKFAASSRQRFESEFSLMATLSTIGILIVIRWAFNSFLLLGVSLLSSLAGYLMGFAACIAIRGEVHSITLTLGGSLLGACVDYSIHWFAERYWRADLSTKEIWKEVSPALGLGMLTSVIAIAPFYLTDSVLLQEFFLFCLGALLGSLVVLPIVPLPRKLTIRKTPYLVSQRVCTFLSKLFQRKWAWGLVILLAAAGLYFFRVDDDLRQLQAPMPELVRDEIRISKNAVPSAYLEIYPKDDAEKFKILQQLLSIFKTTVDGPQLPIEFTLPSEDKQDLAIAQYQQFYANSMPQITTVMEEFGITALKGGETLDLKKIDLDLLKLLVPELFSTSNNLILPVVNWKAGIPLPENVRVIDYRAEISALFRRDRNQSILALVLGYLLIGILLIYRYRTVQALKLLIPCVLAATVTLASIGLLGFPLNFFTTMALALVLGLSVDYAVFFCESKQIEAVSLSVIASAATTAIAFAPLILSDTALLKSIGVTMLIGIVCATVFSPVVSFRITPKGE